MGWQSEKGNTLMNIDSGSGSIIQASRVVDIVKRGHRESQ